MSEVIGTRSGTPRVAATDFTLQPGSPPWYTQTPAAGTKSLSRLPGIPLSASGSFPRSGGSFPSTSGTFPRPPGRSRHCIGKNRRVVPRFKNNFKQENKMSRAKDYIPTTDADFNQFFKNLTQYVNTKCSGTTPEWQHIPKEKSASARRRKPSCASL